MTNFSALLNKQEERRLIEQTNEKEKVQPKANWQSQSQNDHVDCIA